MSYFEAKMHQISISAGALPQTPLGEGGEKGRGQRGWNPLHCKFLATPLYNVV